MSWRVLNKGHPVNVKHIRRLTPIFGKPDTNRLERVDTRISIDSISYCLDVIFIERL